MKRASLLVTVATAFACSLLVLIAPLDTSSSTGIAAGLCGLPQVAFCDTFDQPYGGTPFGDGHTREGALDPSRWSVTRLSQNTSTSQGIYNEFQPSDAMFCKTPITNVLPPRDFFMCDANGTESMHYMDVVNDEGLYVYNSARIRQPFDFTGRTGTIAFDVDAKTAGEHTWWVEVWITDEPQPAAHHVSAVGDTLPRNGLGIMFSNDLQRHGVYMQPQYAIVVNNFNDHAMTDYNGLNIRGGVATMDDMKNHFELRLSQQRLEIWGSNFDGTNFHLLAFVDPLNLPFSRGYVSMQHSQYNAAKESVTKMQTYHWDNVGFDGPVLPATRTYEVPDALQPVPNTSDPPGSLNLGYGLSANRPLLFTLAGVDPTNAATAWVDLNTWWSNQMPVLQYRLNGKTWRTAPGFSDSTGYMWHGAAISVPVTDLVTGVNTLELMTDVHTGIANVDISIAPRDNTVTPPPTVPPTACSPRPNVLLSVVPGGGGVNVTVSAQNSAATSGNTLSALQFAAANNGLIDIGNITGSIGNFTQTLTSGAISTSFHVRPLVRGLPVTVPFTAIDACGPWPTFVGLGASQTLASNAPARVPGVATPIPTATPIAQPTTSAQTASATVISSVSTGPAPRTSSTGQPYQVVQPAAPLPSVSVAVGPTPALSPSAQSPAVITADEPLGATAPVDFGAPDDVRPGGLITTPDGQVSLEIPAGIDVGLVGLDTVEATNASANLLVDDQPYLLSVVDAEGNAVSDLTEPITLIVAPPTGIDPSSVSASIFDASLGTMVPLELRPGLNGMLSATLGSLPSLPDLSQMPEENSTP